MKSPLELLGKGMLAELRANGFVVVHREPTERMYREQYRRNEWPEDFSAKDTWHRMVAGSIKQQNEEAAENGN
jgi:hypothetical protein